MISGDETIVKASYGAAVYDNILLIPDQDTLKFITNAGLHRFLPKWINMTNRVVNEERLEQEVQKSLVKDYLPPPQFRERYAREPQIEKPNSIQDLNYLLIKEIISISPAGKVNPLVYKLSTARTNQQIGHNTIREIYNQILQKTADPEERKYWTFMLGQVLQTEQRFVEELPLLETVLQKGGFHQDLSELDVGIFNRTGRDGETIRAHPFL